MFAKFFLVFRILCALWVCVRATQGWFYLIRDLVEYIVHRIKTRRNKK